MGTAGARTGREGSGVHASVPDNPKRLVARDEAASRELMRPTLTNLCYARPQCPADAYAALDAAVRAAYSLDRGISEDRSASGVADVPSGNRTNFKSNAGA